MTKERGGTGTGDALVALAALLTVLTALAAGAAPLGAQQDVDARWMAWLGCWKPVDAPAAPIDAGAEEPAPSELVCLRPAGDGASVELLAVTDGRITAAERFHAGGPAVRTEAEGCEEVRTADFSEDGARVFTRVRYLCEGGTERTATGVMAFVAPDEWIEVSVVEVEDEGLPWVRRYRPATPGAAEAAGFHAVPPERARAVRMARRAAAAPVTLDGVIEASDAVHPDAVRTWLAEAGPRFRLDADALVRLDEAGVPDEVIDVVVAVSYPERFALDRGEPRERARRSARRAPYGPRWRGPGAAPWYYYDYYYTPFGRRWGYRGPWGGFGPSRVIVIDRTTRPESGGRVVRGRGYTRGSSGSGSSNAPSGSVDRGSSGGSSGGVAPSRGYSGSSADGGRRAKPRGEGGGDDDGGS